jgi:uncharacterized membrane protein (DUF373 family)
MAVLQMTMSIVEWTRKLEKLIIASLMLMMAVVVVLATVELAWLIIKDVTTPPLLILEINELLEIFGVFLLVMIGLELLETIQIYYTDRVIRLEVVMVVALIAVSRKVIVLDYKELSSMTLTHVAALVAALAFAFFLVRKTRRLRPETRAREGS